MAGGNSPSEPRPLPASGPAEHGMEAANALVLQHLRSLNVRDDLAAQLMQELERAALSSPRAAVQASSLVKLVETRPGPEARRRRRPPAISAADEAAGAEGLVVAGEEEEGRSCASLCSRCLPALAASVPSGGLLRLNSEASCQAQEEAAQCIEDDCSGDGGVVTPPSMSIGLIARPPESGYGSPEDLAAASLLPGPLAGGHSPRHGAGHNRTGAPGAIPDGHPSVHGSPSTETVDPSGTISGLAAGPVLCTPVSYSFSEPPSSPSFRPTLDGQAPGKAGLGEPWEASTVQCSRPAVSVPVTLHVYDLGASGRARTLNSVLSLFGVGIFHCGVEVYGREWSFRKCIKGSGVFSCWPRGCQGQSYTESILMGQTVLPKCDVLRLLTSLSKKWLGADYSTLTRNCCHFCKELCRLLNAGPVPEHILAAAATGEYLEVTGMSCRAMLLQQLRGKACCINVGSEDDMEDVPEASPALALPSNTASPSQAIPARLQQNLLDEYNRMSMLRPVTPRAL